MPTRIATHTLPAGANALTVRAFDLAVCLLVAPAVLVVGAVTALLIYIDSPGSVLYRSTRMGRGGEPFQMLKFRKMRRSARGGPLTIGEDERFTPIGSFLAMTKLDELPQLWNVIKGDMRLVGPRPEVPEFVARYPEEYTELLSVLPGITGPAAVEYASESHLLSLQRDPVRFYEESIMPRKIEIDLDYIRTRSLMGDVRILAQTMLVPLAKVARRTSGERQVRRVEAGVLLGACTVLVLIFAIASSANAVGRRHRHERIPTYHRHRHAKPRKARPLKMIWGPFTMPDGSSAFPVYRRLGVQVLQTQLSWAATAPQRPGDPTNPADPAYRWPPTLDRAVREATRYHLQLAVMLRGSPPWSNGGQDSSWAPDDPNDYANFAAAASHRYPTIHHWMIWGEPERPGNFSPMPENSPVGPQRYALLLDAAYGSLKAVNPANIVIGGMTYTIGLDSTADFIRWMRLPNGQPPRLDYFGHNPYSTRYPKLSEGLYEAKVRDINDVDTLHSELAAAYRGRQGGTPKLWLSEFSISSDHTDRAFWFFVSRPVQAKWATAAFKLVDSVNYVAGLGWYELLDEPPTIPGFLTEGLMTSEGTPKPSFYAYQHAR
jgi:lipopolysaccharide/colanic/teichoic acid biosynthesis glycosyltransferase